ncbi:proteolipid protein 2 [Ahaetulla prasina]|uniref:proteolipid protein 2 n=1 Tax=Ahaetulla prasina TaxID=499056 RepID=UPI0026489DFE|nr:proteolipid protein 2 [Ahaetulla prasina]
MESSGGSSKGCMDQFTNLIRSQRGMLLFAEIIACIIILICYGASWSYAYTGLAIFMLIYCIVLFIIFMLELHLQLSFIHWGWTTFIRALIGAVAFIITAIIVLVSRPDGAAIAGAVVSILTGILFGYDAYTILPSLRKSATAAPSEPTEGI